METDCPDCAVAPGSPHVPGCDVARCMVCGMQALTCHDHDQGDQIWTGRWPGDDEVAEGLATDLNDLYEQARSGSHVLWSPERSRFVRREPPIVGRCYLGYMASPWTCVGYDPLTDEAVFRFGQPGYERGDVIVFPWRQMAPSDRAEADIG